MSVLLDLLKKFERCSVFKINHTKSEAMWLGKWKNREDDPFKQLEETKTNSIRQD